MQNILTIFEVVQNLFDTYKRGSVSFTFSLDVQNNNDEKEIYLKSTNILVTACRSTQNLIYVIYVAIFTNCQENVMKKLKDCDFVFDFVGIDYITIQIK